MAVETLQKLAALRTAIEERLVNGLRMTGASSSRTNELLYRFVHLRERARKEYPELFGDLPRRQSSSSIASQAAELREAKSDLDYLLALAIQADLLPSVPRARSPQPATGQTVRKWLREHLTHIAVGLIVAYLVFRFGWN